MENKRGGVRPNSGRKPKDEENRIRDLMKPYSIDAVVSLADIIRSEKSRDADKISAAKLIIAYTYGQPKETIETTHNVNNFDIKEIFNIDKDKQ